MAAGEFGTEFVGEADRVGLINGEWMYGGIGECCIGVWLQEDNGLWWYEESGDAAVVHHWRWEADAASGDLNGDLCDGSILILSLFTEKEWG